MLQDLKHNIVHPHRKLTFFDVLVLPLYTIVRALRWQEIRNAFETGGWDKWFENTCNNNMQWNYQHALTHLEQSNSPAQILDETFTRRLPYLPPRIVIDEPSADIFNLSS